MTTYSEIIKITGFGLLLLPFIVIISAAFLKWLNKKISKFDIPYSKALIIELLIGVVETVSIFILGVIAIWVKSYEIVNFLMLLLLFLLGMPFYSKMIIHPEKGPIGWVKGFTYSIIFGFLNILIQFLLTFLSIYFLSVRTIYL